MVDIHSHILPGLDDGAATLEQSIEMVRLAAASGTTDIVATPHANMKYAFDPKTVARKRMELETAAGGALRIHTGCDFHLQYDNIQDALLNPSKYTVNQKNYLLVEFSEMVIFHTTQSIFDDLIGRGMSPIITHPERNWLLRARIEEMAAWVDSGCYVQITAQSLLGRFGAKSKEFCKVLIERGMVHFVASDGHDCKHRPPRLDEAFRQVAEDYGDDCAQRLFVTNPSAVINGLPVDVLPPVAAPRRKWYRFW